MKELAVMTNNELEVAVDNIRRRTELLDTTEGQKKAAGMMIDVLHIIESAGYEPKTDLADMAMIWVMVMREQIAVYQFKGIREAVIEFIKTDTREYKQFPSAGQIMDICMRIGKNPRVELSRRRQAEFERWVDEEKDREMAELPEEYKKACVERVKKFWKVEE